MSRSLLLLTVCLFDCGGSGSSRKPEDLCVVSAQCFLGEDRCCQCRAFGPGARSSGSCAAEFPGHEIAETLIECPPGCAGRAAVCDPLTFSCTMK